MLPTKFQVNWLLGLGEEAKNRFSRWLSWRPSWISDCNYFWSTSQPQVSSQLAQGCRRSRLLKQLFTPHDGHWLTTIAHHEHFMLRWANNFIEMFLGWPSTKIAKMVPLCWIEWPPKLKIVKTFKQHLLSHWLDFKIIPQKCSLGDSTKIAKWFCSAEQNGCHS